MKILLHLLPHLLPKILISAALLVCLFAPAMAPAMAAEMVAEISAPSSPAGLSVTMTSQLSPLSINQMHSWEIRLQDSDGNAVADAEIEVRGGMPAHNHGLATQPQVTRYLGDGRYLLQGVRFHMAGAWELQLLINLNGTTYRSVLNLEL